MSPSIQNILVTLAGFVYVFGVVKVMDMFVQKGFPQDISRKVVHVAAGSWLIFWPLYDASHWTKYLNILPAAVWTVLLLVKGFTADENDEAVKTMTRTGDRRELLKGPLFFTIVMDLLGTIWFYNPAAITAMGFLGWGDGAAPVIGKRYGKHKYKILSEKSVEGSLGFLIFGFAGAVLFNLLLNGTVNWELIFYSAFVTVIVEAISPANWDNIFIPVSVLLLYYFF
jgi:dolichol kinase